MLSAKFLGIVLVETLIAGFVICCQDTKWYWWTGLAMYIFSFLAAWTIGLYLLVFPVVLWLLALARSLGWITRAWHYVPVIILGLTVWYLSVMYVDDAWLFLPFMPLVWLLS